VNSTGFSRNIIQWLSETGRIFHSFEIYFIHHFQNFATYAVYKNIESAPWSEIITQQLRVFENRVPMRIFVPRGGGEGK
jgi:hypothetical protein